MFIFFFNDTATTEIYTLSLHDALPICVPAFNINNMERALAIMEAANAVDAPVIIQASRDRKSTRLNSSHANISYAVFCLKKKKTKPKIDSVITSHQPTY